MSYRYNGDGVLINRDGNMYVQDLAAPLSQLFCDRGNVHVIYGSERLHIIESGRATWHLHDGLGCLRQTLDSSGAVTGAASYDPWE